MKNKYLETITMLLKQARSRLAATHKLEFKNVFGAVAGYVDGKIFISCGKFGVALRLPPDMLDTLFQAKEAKHLKYFPNGHVKKEYVVLSKRMLENKHQLKKFVDESIKYVLSARMKPEQAPITGREDKRKLSGPVRALVEFYGAFNSRDLEKISDTWAQSDEIAMDNPLGGIKRGWAEIQPVYERIFSGPAEVYVEYFDYTIHETSEMFYVVGREHGYFRLGGEEITLAIRTSRIFKKIDGRWKQVHHHGSIDNPELLARYQSAVKGNYADRRSLDLSSCAEE